ncbi:hypothetical protein L1987_87575 [Smallanthus sonchifolius]|nr:hypothetical protein L1987_87575 [Smallanthus sonchifolius]
MRPQLRQRPLSHRLLLAPPPSPPYPPSPCFPLFILPRRWPVIWVCNSGKDGEQHHRDVGGAYFQFYSVSAINLWCIGFNRC